MQRSQCQVEIPADPVLGRTIVLLLAFVGGWVDVASFVGLDKLLAAHITGNIVLLAADLAGGFGESEILRLGAIPVFFGAVVAITLIHDRHVVQTPTREARIPRLLMLEALLLFGGGGFALVMTHGPAALSLGPEATIALPAVVAMACQNAAHRLYPSIGPATTVMTGNITQFFIDQTRRLSGTGHLSPDEPLPRGERGLPVLILAFTLGCIASAFVTTAVGPSSLLVPGLLLFSACLYPIARTIEA